MTEKIHTILIVTFGILLFVILSQPVWRGHEMLTELKNDCNLRGGVMLEHKKTFATEYQCVSRLD